jgi:hypothetical protein
MSKFWKGFHKQAKESEPFQDWIDDADAEEETLKTKQQKNVRVEPRELSESRSPDVYYRYWP